MKIFKSVPAVALTVFVITRLIVLFGYAPYADDVEFYYQIAKTVVAAGGAVYRDSIYGYPPFSLSTIYLPYYFSGQYGTYRFLYQVTNVFFDFITFIYVGKFLLERLQVDSKRLSHALIFYAILGPLHGHYIYNRVDMFIVMCFMLALYYGSDRRFDKKYFTSLTWGVLGTLWKVIPIFWLPILVFLKARREGLKGFVVGTLYALAPTALFIWIYNLLKEGTLIKALTLHSDRGIQVESLFATPFMLWRAFDVTAPVLVEQSHGAHHMAGAAIAGGYVLFSKYFGFAVLAAFYIFVGRTLLIKFKDSEFFEAAPQAPAVFFLMSSPLILFLIFQRVLSTTFMIWLIPIVTIFWALQPRKFPLIVAFLISLLTFIGFDLGYYPYIGFDKFYGVVYFVRNVLLVVYGFYFARVFLQFLKAQEPAKTNQEYRKNKRRA